MSRNIESGINFQPQDVPRVSATLARPDYSFQRKGQIDQQYYNRKVRKAVRDNMGNIVNNPDLLVPGKDGMMRIPQMPDLDEYRFRFDPGSQEGFGQGTGDSKVGDKIGGRPKPGEGVGAGDEPGSHPLEIWIPEKEFWDEVFDGWRLPNLRAKQGQSVSAETVRFTDVRRSGPIGNLDKKRTILTNIKRNAMRGDPRFGGIERGDMRFKTWEPVEERRSQALVIYMRDISGSMGKNEQDASRSYYHLVTRFLERNYEEVQKVFITHDTKAAEVDSDTFFGQTSGGGTAISSAFEMANSIVDDRFAKEEWNIYSIHLSDGDNNHGDNQRAIGAADTLLSKSSAMHVVEISQHPYGYYFLDNLSKQVSNEYLVTSRIPGPQGVYSAASQFFTQRGESES